MPRRCARSGGGCTAQPCQLLKHALVLRGVLRAAAGALGGLRPVERSSPPPSAAWGAASGREQAPHVPRIRPGTTCAALAQRPTTCGDRTGRAQGSRYTSRSPSRARSRAPWSGTAYSADPGREARSRPQGGCDRAEPRPRARAHPPAPTPPLPIYTSKSYEEGLEKAFKARAQREACEAYTRSQRHEGGARSRRTTTAACGRQLGAAGAAEALGDLRAARSIGAVYKGTG